MSTEKAESTCLPRWQHLHNLLLLLMHLRWLLVGFLHGTNTGHYQSDTVYGEYKELISDIVPGEYRKLSKCHGPCEYEETIRVTRYLVSMRKLSK